MARYQIPLVAGSQSLAIGLGDFQYQLTIVYRWTKGDGGGWFLDLVRSDGSGAVYGLPIITGVDLLGQHQYLGFGHLYAELEGGASRRPTYEDMGAALSLYWDDGNAD